MTIQEMMSQIRQLSREDRIELLEMLNQSLRDQWQRLPRELASLDRVRGLLRPDGPIPTEVELADEYTTYLLEKYT